MSPKSETNKKWTSSEAYRDNYNRIFLLNDNKVDSKKRIDTIVTQNELPPKMAVKFAEDVVKDESNECRDRKDSI